jgi:site-specific DNA-methyltransferase (adenine-specific)
MEMTYQLHLGDCLDVLATLPDNSVDSIVTDPPYGLSFMGKKWDYDVPSVAIWEQCLRVLKPGGHLLAFAGTRTQHRMACRIEDAGFEIRDMIAWVYGSGFPKSLDVSKAIDKAAGAEREVVGSRKLTGTARIKGQAAFGATSGRSEEAYQDGSDINDTLQITAPATHEAQQWSGWGTALKPALEPITMARKPFSSTVAANVIQYGTGAINVEVCRVKIDDDDPIHKAVWTSRPSKIGLSGVGFVTSNKDGDRRACETSKGRWPANIIHDGSNEAALSLKSGARFFYTAKAGKVDRESENNHPTVKPTMLMAYLCRLITQPGGTILDPFMGSGSTGKAATINGFRFIGIERDPEYHKISEARISNQHEGRLF